ncbi:MAG: hypothetical protein WDZ51_02885 [Pirellulaceae bacterium]
MGLDAPQHVTYEMRAAQPIAGWIACVLLHGIVLGFGFAVALAG